MIINGQRSAPYKIGGACSQCPSDRPNCANSLCSGQGELPCRNSRNYFVCKQFQARGFCQMCSKHFWQMNKECNETCGFCKLQYQHGGDDLGDGGGRGWSGTGSGAQRFGPSGWWFNISLIPQNRVFLIAIALSCLCDVLLGHNYFI